MQPSYYILWSNPDDSGNQQSRVRMVVSTTVFDETITVPAAGDTDAAINERMTAIAAGQTAADPNADQIVTPINEVNL